MSDTSNRTSKTNAEIEALLGADAENELGAGTGRVSRRVVARLRTDTELRERRTGMRIGRVLDDDGRIPRWFLAAAVLAISALAGWMLFGPSAAPTARPTGNTPHEVAQFPDPAMFDVSAHQLLALAWTPQHDMLKREARALVGAGWELAGRVLGGIPIEFVKPSDERRGAG